MVEHVISRCPACDWHYAHQADVSAESCPHCYQAALELVTLDGSLPPAELWLPQQLSADSIRHRIDHFAKGLRFAPPDLNADTLLARVQPLYLPLWLVDSDVSATWQAEVGFDYEVVSHQEQFVDGRWRTREVTEPRIRWEQRIGRLTRHYANVPVPALSEYELIAEQLDPFDTDAAVPADGAAWNGALVRLPNRSTAAAWPDAQPALLGRARDDCRAAAEAQHIRQFKWQADYAGQHWTQLLVPLLSTYYRDDDGRPLPVLLHGRTGALYGVRRASPARARRTALLLLVAGMLCFALAVALQLTAPDTVGGLLALLGVALALGAVYPLAYTHQLNSKPVRPIWGTTGTPVDPTLLSRTNKTAESA